MHKVKKQTILDKVKLLDTRYGHMSWKGCISGKQGTEVVRTLQTVIFKASNEITETTRDVRLYGNNIIASPDVVAALQCLDQFQMNKKVTKVKGIKGLELIGNLGDKMVYRDIEAFTSYIVMFCEDVKCKQLLSSFNKLEDCDFMKFTSLFKYIDVEFT